MRSVESLFLELSVHLCSDLQKFPSRTRPLHMDCHVSTRLLCSLAQAVAVVQLSVCINTDITEETSRERAKQHFQVGSGIAVELQQ